MGFAGYLDTLDLDPITKAKVLGLASGPAPVAPIPKATGPAPVVSADVSDAPPTAAEIAAYRGPNADPAAAARDANIARNATTAATTGAANVASPTAQPSWTPEQQQQRESDAREAAAADSPQDLGDQGGGGASQRATPGVYVAPHWLPTTRSEAIAYGTDPEKLAGAMSYEDAAAGHHLAAGDKRLEAAQQRGMADAVYSAAHAQAAQQAAQQMQRLQAQKEAYVANEQDKLNQLTTAAAAKVDPDAAKGTLGAQTMAAIGVALGAFGASITGGQNTALQIVTANIDRNIKAQETNIANAKGTLRDEQSLYKQNLDAFGDRERAVLATKMQYLEQVKAMSDQQYAAAQNTSNIADKHEWDAKIMKEQADVQRQFVQLTDDKRTSQGSEHFVPGGMVGGSANAPKKDLPNLVTLSDGTTVQMPNEKQQDKAIEKIQVVTTLQRMNNEALKTRKLIADVDPLVHPFQYKALHKTLEDLEETKASLLSTEAGQGVLRDSEYARSIARQGFYTEGVGVFKGNPIAAGNREAADANIRRQIARGDETQRGMVQAAGGRIVERGYATDANGQKVPVARYTGQDIKPVEALPSKGFKPIKKSDTDNPTADDSLEDTTPSSTDFGFIPAAAPSSGKGGKGGGKGGGAKPPHRK